MMHGNSNINTLHLQNSNEPAYWRSNKLVKRHPILLHKLNEKHQNKMNENYFPLRQHKFIPEQILLVYNTSYLFRLFSKAEKKE
jgi:hypothetical protein